ncbi:MAG TPA: histidine kinase [Verrucomicrobiae bacterium]|nr:histidine kinase [Verrucomicrobiae bacterium]
MQSRLAAARLGASWPGILLALVVAGSAQALSIVQPGPAADGRALDLLLVAAATVPLAWAHRHPLMVFAVGGGAALLHVLLGYQNPFPVTFAVLASVFQVAARARPRRAVAAAALVALALPLNFAASWHTAGHISWSDIPYNYGLFAAAFILGDDVRQRRARVIQLQRRAARLEVEQAEGERRAAELERERIARELHDTIGHHLSVIVLQAGAGRRVTGEPTERAAALLGSIEDSARQALTEVRRLLHLAGTPAPDDRLAPQPGLGDLDQLVTQVSRTGLAVQLSVEGVQRPLPPSLELSAYRIVQEALTNTLRHADARSAWVTVRYRPDDLQLCVRDDGRGGTGPAGGGGRGLVGMRQRAALFGGQLRAGPGAAGGYRVAVILPLEPG